MGTTEALARFIAETQYDDLPAAVVAAAKIGILDGVANLLAGSTQPVAQIVSAYTLELGGTPVSSVIGHGFKTNPLNAAFANGVSGHCLDFELQGQPSSHGTSSILPGPLALAEAQGGASGKELIVAYALGWSCTSTSSIHSGVSRTNGMTILLCAGSCAGRRGLPLAEQPGCRHWCGVERGTVLSPQLLISGGQYRVSLDKSQTHCFHG